MPASPPRTLQVVHAETGAVLAARARLADTFFSRLRGLLGTRSLGDGEALVIEPCNSVHTMGMRYPIDVVFASPEGEVVEVYHALAPWRATRIVSGARLAVELPSGAAAPVRRGHALRFDPGP